MDRIKHLEPLWGTWRVQDKLGAGSYGMVYRAVQTMHNHTYTCAVKHISIPRDEMEHTANETNLGTQDPEVLAAYYEQEVQRIADEYDVLRMFAGKPNFVQVYDILSVPRDDMPGFDLLIRMELLNPVSSRFPAGMLPAQTEKEVIRLGMDICRALIDMHAKQYVHRDIKPENILVSDDGVYKLADFGTARAISGSANSMSIRGTMDYIAPEIIRGQKAGFLSDLYSLGLVLHSLLNRRQPPFGGDSMVRRLSGETLPAPVDASPEMTEIIRRACAYEPERRYSGADVLYADLEKLSLGTASAPSAKPAKPAAAAAEAAPKKASPPSVPSNIPESLRERYLSAAQGSAQAQYNLGCDFYYGRSCAKDLSEARKWFLKAARQGNVNAQYFLGVMAWPEKDSPEAEKWMRMAAEQGHANAQYYLGFICRTGRGVPRDDQEALKWFRKAAEQGMADAQYELGVMAWPEKDSPEAEKWMRMAAEQGHAKAQYFLGVIYEGGRGVPRDDQEALKWFRKAAEQGYEGAAEKAASLEKEIEYQTAEALYRSGEYASAMGIFQNLSGYRDSDAQRTKCAWAMAQSHAEKTAPFKVIGNTVRFGSYPQSAHRSHAAPIEWTVLDVRGSHALLISRCVLDCQPYHTAPNTDVTWASCSLRSWLNSTFLSHAFSPAERSALLSANVVNSTIQGSSKVSGGQNTHDRVFLLSHDEAGAYFATDHARTCAPTDYAVSRQAYRDSNGHCAWWLRSPGATLSSAALVRSPGDRHFLYTAHNHTGVRPAIWLDLSADAF